MSELPVWFPQGAQIAVSFMTSVGLLQALLYLTLLFFAGYALHSRHAPPMALIAPAYNEALTIIESVEALLLLQCPDFEIIVVNDGSKDQTLNVLINDYGLQQVHRYHDLPVQCEMQTLMIISGSFGAFRRDAVIEVGGFSKGTVGEDFEVVVKLHRHFRKQARPYKVKYIPDAAVWTEAPETLKILGNQRARWQRGTLETYRKHTIYFLIPALAALALWGLVRSGSWILSVRWSNWLAWPWSRHSGCWMPSRPDLPWLLFQ